MVPPPALFGVRLPCDVDAPIAAANARYVDVVVPEIDAEEAAVRAEAAAREQRVADARDTVDAFFDE